MKTGGKKNSGGIQQMAAEHVEKVVFGLAAALILVCAVMAIQTETYDGTPDELVRKARDAQTQIMGSEPTPALNDLPELVRWDQREERSSQVKLNETSPLNMGGTFGVQIYTKRGMPELLAAGDVQASFMGVSIAEQGEGTAPAEGVGGVAAADGGNEDDDDAIVRPGNVPPGVAPEGQFGEGGEEDLEQFGEGAGIDDEEDDLGGEGEYTPDEPMDASSRAGILPPAGSVAKGYLMSIITARVPMKKQVLYYQQAYERSRKRDARLDFPQYVTFLIQRKDVTNGENAPWVDRSGLGLIRENLDLRDKWAAVYPEIANPRRVVPLTKYSPLKLPFQGLTSPLPPLLDQDFGDEVTGPFERYIKPPEEPEDDPDADIENPFDFGPPTDPAPEAAAPTDEPPAVGRSPVTGRRFYASGGRGGQDAPGLPPGYPGPGAGEGLAPPGFDPSGGQPGEDFGVGDPLEPGLGPGGAFPDGLDGGLEGGFDGGFDGGMEGVVGDDLTGELYPDLLLRFCDFTVEEGRRYRYRVQLILMNPNHGIDAHHLEDESTGVNPYVKTEWSEPTDVVSVTGHSEVLAGPASPAIGALNPSVKVIVRQRDRETGANVSHEFAKVERGQLLNFEVKSSRRNKLRMADPITKRAKELDEFEFETDEMLVDLAGGEKLPGRGYHTAPGESLLMDARGWLSVKSELSDEAPNYHAEKKRLERLEPVEYERADDFGDDSEVGDGEEEFNPFEDFGPRGKGRGRGQPPGFPNSGRRGQIDS